MKFIRSLFLCFLFFFTIHPASAQDLTDFVPITSETSGVENSPSDPATCNGANIGRLYFNTVSNRLFVCNGTEFVVSTDDMNRTVFVDSTRPTRAGEVYATLATAVAYINTQTPTSINPFAIVVQQGTNSESVTLSAHTVLAGTHRTKNTFTGTITLSNGSAVQDVTVSGSLNIENGNTGHVTSSDVVLGDGGGGGIDGNLTIHNSLVDGSIAASSIVTALSSQLGVAVLVNAGTINTYSSSVFNLSGAGVWNNFSVAYDNLLQNSSDRLDAETLQQAVDELVLGTPADNFVLNENQSVPEDVVLQFGNLVIESLEWDEAQDYFFLSDSLVVDGNINLQGTTLRLDSDEAGNPDQDLEIIAEQGSESDGIIRYDDGNNRWEISNNGGSFAAISTGSSGSSTLDDAYDGGGAGLGSSINADSGPVQINGDGLIIQNNLLLPNPEDGVLQAESSVDNTIFQVESSDGAATARPIFRMKGDDLADKAFMSQLSSEGFGRYNLEIGGAMQWGGGAARDVELQRTNTGTLQIQNDSTLTTDSGLQINNQAPGDLDPKLEFQLSGTTQFSLGVDDSAGDAFKISSFDTLGTDDHLIIEQSGDVKLGNNSGTVIFDGTNFDVSNEGTVTLTGNLFLSGDGNEGVSGGGLVDCDAANQSLQWDATTNRFSCTTAGNRTATFNDPTDDNNVSYTSATDVWDGTHPNITTSSTSSTVLVSVVIQTRSEDNSDEQPAFRITRETNGTDPTCTDPQVGIDLWGSFITTSNQEQGISGTFLDSPGVAGTVRYGICTSDSGLNDGNVLDIQMTLVEMGN